MTKIECIQNEQKCTKNENEIEDIQTTIIIPKPNDESTYYIFSAKENQVNGLIHSIIRFTPEFPLGYLEEQNILMEREPISRIAAIHHGKRP